MSTQLTLLSQIQQHRANLPAHLRDRLASGVARELGEGITSGFAVVSLRGKAWRIKHRGDERILYEEDGRRPRYALNVVLVKASPNISKIWYEHGYTEGSNAPPDCWSVDGRVPDMASPKRQNPTCAGCRWNAWGSSRMQGGTGKGKDCADSKRLAIVPASDVANEAMGGPMLLRIPPASLGELGKYSAELAALGVNYYEVETEMSFDPTTEYPKVLFRAVGMIDAEALETVVEQRDGQSIDRILATPIEVVHTDGVDQSHTNVAPPAPVPAQQAPQQPPAGFKPQTVPTIPAAPAAPAPAPQPAAPAAPPPAPEPKVNGADVSLVDPRLQALIAAGLAGEQLVATAKVLGIPMPAPAAVPEPAAPPPAPPAAAAPAAPAAKGNPFAAPNGEPASEPTPAPAPAPAKRGRKTAEKVEALVGAPPPAEAAAPPSEAAAAADEPAAGSLPPDFDDLLMNVIK